MKPLQKSVLLAIGASLLFIKCDCTSTAGSFFFPPKSEIELGVEFDKDIRTKETFLSSTQGTANEKKLVQYIDSIGRSIVAKIPNSDWEHLTVDGEKDLNFFTFSVIKSDVENAFAVPGGFTYFYTSILKKMTTESELIGVMGHEIGHVIAHHSRDRMMKAGAAQTIISILAGGEGGNKMIEITGALGAQWWLNQHGQEDELESDSIGVEFAQDLNIYPLGISDYFGQGLELDADGECKEKDSGFLASLGEAFSTHPPHCDRIDQAIRLVGDQLEAKEWKGNDEEEYKLKVLDLL